MTRIPFTAMAAGLGAVTVLSLASIPAPQRAGGAAAQGVVTGFASRASGVRVTAPFPISAGSLVGHGWWVVLARAGSAVVRCVTGPEVMLNGPVRWQVTEANCARDGRHVSSPTRRVGREAAVITAVAGGHVEYETQAVPLRLYPAGSVFHARGNAAQLALLCSTDAFVLKRNARNWTLTEETCARDGTPVEPGAYRDLVGFASLRLDNPSAELIVDELGRAPGEYLKSCVGLMAPGRERKLDPRPPGASVRPPAVRVPFTIEFLNGRCGPIRVSSMDSTGAWVRRGEVPPGREDSFESFIAEPWLVEENLNPGRSGPPTWLPIAIYLAGQYGSTWAHVDPDLARAMAARAPGTASAQDVTTGVVSRVNGGVRAITPYPLREGGLLAPGAFIALAAGAGGVTVICANYAEVRLTAPARWQVSEQNCGRDARGRGNLEEVLARSGRRVPDRGFGFGFWGAVVASAGGGGRIEYEEPAVSRRVYPAGSVFRGDGDSARVAILCSTDVFVMRQNPRDWTLGAASCARDGQPVEPGAYRDLVGFASLAMNDPSAELLVEPLARFGTWPGCQSSLPLDDQRLIEPRRPGTPPRRAAVLVPVTIDFINGLCGTIRLSSMDTTGAWVPRGDVESDSYSDDFESWITQPWLVEVDTNATRSGPAAWAPVAIFLAGDQGQSTGYAGPALANAMTLCRAIDARRPVSFRIGESEHRVEPHAVGAVTDRFSWSSRAVQLTTGLLAWRETPDSTGWVRYPDLDEIGGLRILDGAFTPRARTGAGSMSGAATLCETGPGAG